jgi:hypothetical protein
MYVSSRRCWKTLLHPSEALSDRDGLLTLSAVRLDRPSHIEAYWTVALVLGAKSWIASSRDTRRESRDGDSYGYVEDALWNTGADIASGLGFGYNRGLLLEESQSYSASGYPLTFVLFQQKAMPTLALHPFPSPDRPTRHRPYTPSERFVHYQTVASNPDSLPSSRVRSYIHQTRRR